AFDGDADGTAPVELRHVNRVGVRNHRPGESRSSFEDESRPKPARWGRATPIRAPPGRAEDGPSRSVEPSPRLFHDAVDDIFQTARAGERLPLPSRPVPSLDRAPDQRRDLVPLAGLLEGGSQECEQRIDYRGRRDGATGLHLDQLTLKAEPRGPELGGAE